MSPAHPGRLAAADNWFTEQEVEIHLLESREDNRFLQQLNTFNCNFLTFGNFMIS